MSRSTEERYRDMLIAAMAAVEYLGDRSLTDLQSDPMRLDAIVMNVIRIGEAAARIIDQEEPRHPDLPWLRMIGMRNIVVHRYFETREEIVFVTARDHLPPLIRQLQEIVDEA